MAGKNILYSKDEAVAVVQFNRPDALNAFNLEMLNEMDAILENIAADDTVRAVVLKGSDQVFSCGADVRDFVNYGPLEVRDYIEKAHQIGYKLFALAKPTIASLAGFALGGGCEMAMTCDLRIAADNAKLGFPEINLGIFPAAGGTQRLARLVGCARARELILTGDIIDSRKALEYTLVNKVVPAAELEEATMKLARKLSRKPPLAVQMVKELLDLSQHLDPYVGTKLEREKFAVLFASQDKTEGMTAFLEGRKPNFTGR